MNWKWLVWGLVIFSFGYAVSGLYLATHSSTSDVVADSESKQVEEIESTPMPTYAPLNISKALSYNEPKNMTMKHDGLTTLLVTGDVLLARTVNAKMVGQTDFSFPFVATAAELGSADISFVNLETPLTADCQVKTTGMLFCGDVRAVDGLSWAGVDVANFANNHAGNQGGEGIVSTIDVLRKAGIAVTGVGEPVIIERNGKKFGFLGFDDIPPRTSGIAWADVADVKKQIWDLRPKVDFVIVQFHWGVEYTNRATAQQRMLAHAAVDAGADVVVGNHPHWVQGVELYKDKFIAYSHGNFIFDQQWSKETTEGVVGKYTFDSEKLVGVEYYPVILDKSLQTRWASQAEAERILVRMREGSK